MTGKTLIIMTGGTIDAEAYPDPQNPPKDATMLESSLIPMTVAQMGHGADCDFLSWKAKDSKHFTDDDMRDLAKIIRTSHADTVIITHGTDAMPENSRRIRKFLREVDSELRVDTRENSTMPERAFVRGESRVKDKRVVFTGAMMPLANGPESDAYKNLQYIFEHKDQWRAGVRVVMHETSFDPVGLSKDFSTYQFKGRVISYPSSVVLLS